MTCPVIVISINCDHNFLLVRVVPSSVKFCGLRCKAARTDAILIRRGDFIRGNWYFILLFLGAVISD